MGDDLLMLRRNKLLLTLVMTIILGLIPFLSSSPQVAEAIDSKDTVFQVSTINALLQGVYDGSMTCRQLKGQGDLGIGTFEGLDGEMIALDGQIFQVKADGKVYSVNDQERVPFAAFTFFEADQKRKVRNIGNYEQLQKQINQLIPNKNLFYAIRIDGTFSYVKNRSVPKQIKPYPVLVEVTKNQPTFELNNVEGTLIGFWCPEYVQGINVPGYHLHFITKDRQAGGHLLECRLVEGNLMVDTSADFHLVLPVDGDFGKVDLGKDSKKELEAAEK